MRLLAVPALAFAALLIGAAAGAIEPGWGWISAAMSLCAGATLLMLAPSSRTMYVGALVRLVIEPRALWSLRAAVVVTAPIAGLGPALYATLAMLQAAVLDTPARQLQPDWQRALGTGLAGLAVVIAAVELGLSVGSEQLLWAVLLGSAGLSAFWWSGALSPQVRSSAGVALALILLGYGVFAFGGSPDGAILAGLAGAVIAMVVFGPRWLRNSRAASAERARQARIEERAEVAEMVHDSVLQTLALIQSRADDPAEVKALARTQERDLRARLFGERDPDERPTSIATALQAVAAEVEDRHRIKIEVVTVGDAPLDERSAALVAAAREALFNAARHAEGAPLSLFGEVDGRHVTAYVRDRGPGFELEAVPADRRGVTDSIVARMVRHGGHAAVRTAPGGGCEVRLMVERGR
jgi:signal transduction histidine kinase